MHVVNTPKSIVLTLASSILRQYHQFRHSELSEWPMSAMTKTCINRYIQLDCQNPICQLARSVTTQSPYRMVIFCVGKTRFLSTTNNLDFPNRSQSYIMRRGYHIMLNYHSFHPLRPRLEFKLTFHMDVILVLGLNNVSIRMEKYHRSSCTTRGFRARV